MIRCSGVSKFLQSSVSKRVLRPNKSARLDLRQAALEGARQAGVGAPGGARCVPFKWIVYGHPVIPKSTNISNVLNGTKDQAGVSGYIWLHEGETHKIHPKCPVESWKKVMQ